MKKNKLLKPKTKKCKSPKTKTGLILCPECNAAYYKKSWRHNLRHLKNIHENLPIKFIFCIACNIIKNKQFKGQIEIINAYEKISKELINLIELFCNRAYKRNPMHRLINITQTNSKLRRTNMDKLSDKSMRLMITTTENQLAVRLAKKIKQTFKKAEMKISYSSTPSDIAHIKLTFE